VDGIRARWSLIGACRTILETGVFGDHRSGRNPQTAGQAGGSLADWAFRRDASTARIAIIERAVATNEDDLLWRDFGRE
jgi:hypothetical protein